MKGVKLKDVAEAHARDLEVQGKDGVSFRKYWLDEKEPSSALQRRPTRKRSPVPTKKPSASFLRRLSKS